MREQVINRILEKKIIAIVRGLGKSQILPLAEALCKGGISMIEVTFNQAKPETFAETAEAVKSIREELGGQVYAGAGTVITLDQLKMAADAGALYVISPDTNVKIIGKTRELGLVSIPGAATPTECASAVNAGADFVKLFPAGGMGVSYFKAIKAPLSHIRFLGVGGIDIESIPDFLAAGMLGFGVGGNLVNKEWIDRAEFDKITALAARYVRAVQGEGGTK
jgi:2-dehydro-3-deoxyphosphogluconate aldolase/(4S)-4-hydroxy-2-oxoglutarate aldolase